MQTKVPPVLVLMGVSGSGKSTLGKLLSSLSGWPFYDGDDFHPPANVEKMRQGIPLTDEDRRPWLIALRGRMQRSRAAAEGCIIACSALKQSYRDLLSEGNEGICWVWLKGDAETLRQRMEARSGHFMPPGLLQSQLAALEAPLDALVADITEPPEKIARMILESITPPA
ncbi:MAG: gluconokinase [Bacteroidetes bacterium]|nr:MAG: gluconokinase [Bacteroidota bacterium]